MLAIRMAEGGSFVAIDTSAIALIGKERSTHDFESNRSWRFTQVGGAGRVCVIRRRKRAGLGAKRAAGTGEFRGDDVFQLRPRSRHDLIFGGSGGRAILFARNDQTGRWEGPAFYNLATASVGFQAGIAVSETVTLVMTDKGLNSLLATSVKVGGDASIAAGPVGAGANADVTTDFVAFARSKGVYGGLNLDGTVIHVADNWNRAYYGRDIQPPDILVRASAHNPQADRLVAALNRASSAKTSLR
jgi:Las17-binding protein actin regulator